MKIEVIPFAAAIDPASVRGKNVVLIDVLRATSVMITALHNGAKEIIPCLTAGDAFAAAGHFTQSSYLLCGERDAIKLEGFDLGNSPLEYNYEEVAGKSLILTTTNGTEVFQVCA